MTDRQVVLWLHADGRVSSRLPLPWRTRLRICVHHRIDVGAIWLLDHGRERAAVGLWRACGMWR